jgi:NAD(P)-dependent dehydrogenase (short-subunit alcohol dehydrogenase family)
MGGTVILTGANSSLAIPAVEHILTAFPAYHLLLTVRDASSADSNTEKLRETISRHPGTKATIIQVDFAELAAVRNFVKNVTEGVASGRYPRLSAIICNAHYWDLIGEAQLTADGYEKTLQICHIAHAALVLPLLGQFGPESGRVVLLSSLAHWAGKSQMEKYPPGLPEDLNTLARPVPDPDYYGRGFQRYGNAKLAIVTWMHALNRRLEEVRHLIVMLTQLLRHPLAGRVTPPHLCRGYQSRTACRLPWLADTDTSKHSVHAVAHVSALFARLPFHGSYHADISRGRS